MARNKFPIFIILFILIMITACTPCTPPGISSVTISLYPQQRDWWCWAASTEMISSYYGHRVLQPDSANFVHGQPPDCSVGCDCWGSAWGASITDIQNNWTQWDFTYTYESDSLSWDNLKSTISNSTNCGKSPIMVIWWFYGGGGHVVVAYGYADTNAGDFVSYRDPWPPSYTEPDHAGDPCVAQAGGGDHVTTYAAFVDDGVHNWGDSFHHFVYQAP